MKAKAHVRTAWRLVLMATILIAGPALAQRMGRMGPGMMRVRTTSEASFLVHMIPHHQEAIDSSRQLLNVTERPELIDLAEGIIETQSTEIEAMESWLDAWHPDVDREVAYEPMMRDLSGSPASEIERAFLEDMIMHHMMAVREARMLLARGYAEHDEVAELARSIIASQTSEMRQMSSWLAEWFGVRGPMGGGPGRMMGF